MRRELLLAGLVLALSGCGSSGASSEGNGGEGIFGNGNDPSTVDDDAGGGTSAPSDASAGNGNGNGNGGNGNGGSGERDAGTGPGSADAGNGNADAGGGNAQDAGAGVDAGGEQDAGTGGGNEVPTVSGCAGQMLREGIPEDLGKPGPWPVGALTTTLGNVKTEVWYPAQIGSDKGKAKVIYDITEHLPDPDQKKIPPARNPLQSCNCFRSLPLDTGAGPYPVLLFIHGTAGFRTTNAENAVHWASRGFVVVASDHPGITLKDMLGLGGGNRDQAGDAKRVLAALATPSGAVAFLKDHIDMTRVGVMGHSAGANAASSLVDVADVIIPYAGGSAMTSGRVKSVMFASGDQDGVVAASTTGYDNSTPKPKRLAWITHGGHLVGGSLCSLRDPTDKSVDIVDLANEFQLGNALIRPFMGSLFDGCNKADPNVPDKADGTFISAARGIEIMSYLSTGQFEEALHCSSTAAAQLKNTMTKFGADVSSYKEQLP